MISSAPLTLPLGRPRTILDTLKNILDEPDDLSKFLPSNVVQQVDQKDTIAGHIPHRIRFGVINNARGTPIDVYAYMSTSHRQKNLPEIHFYGHQSHGSMKRYPQEDIIMEGELDVEFQPAKNIGSPAFLVLLQVTSLRIVACNTTYTNQCLFILGGVAMPVDCTVSARSILEARNICYRFKNHRDEHMDDHTSDESGLDESITSLELALPTPSPQPAEGTDARDATIQPDQLITPVTCTMKDYKELY
jgi:hypothetical protein